MTNGNPERRPVAAIAIGAAVLALLTSLIAIVVVAMRSPSAAAPAEVESSVAAVELAKLRVDTVEPVMVDGKIVGVRVRDDKLRGVLGLADGDVITNLAGRPIRRDSDVREAMSGVIGLEMSVVHADVLRGGESVHLRWEISGDLRTVGGVGGTKPDGTPRDPLLDTIKKVDEFHYEVPRATIDRIAGNITDFSRGARVVPAMKNGLPEGFKLYAVRPNSLFAAIGLANGDTIRAINGLEMTSLDKVMETYEKLKDAKELAIDITRRGKYELITITIR